MGLLAAFALLALPVAEIAVFVMVGGQIGVWPTIALVVFSAFIGAALLREEGFEMLHQARLAVEQNASPIGPLFDGLCKMTAGILFIVPGFITDVVALLLLFPPFRHVLKGFLARNVHGVVWTSEGAAPFGESQGTVVEGEFHVVGEETMGENAGREDDAGREKLIEGHAVEVEEPDSGDESAGGAAPRQGQP